MSDGTRTVSANVKSGDIEKSCTSVVDQALAQELVCSNYDTNAKEIPPDDRPRTRRKNRKQRREATATARVIIREKSQEKVKPKSIGDETTTGRKEVSNRRPSFPEKLMDMLRKCSNESTAPNKREAAPVRWLPDGNGFEIVSIHQFTLEVLPHFFGHIEFSSFTRKLYWWGFKKARLDCDAFYHHLFTRDDPEQCSKIRARRSGYHEYDLPVTNSAESSLQGTNENPQLTRKPSSSHRTSATPKREAPSLTGLSLPKRLRLSGDEEDFPQPASSGDSPCADEICLHGVSSDPLSSSPPLSATSSRNFSYPTAGLVSFSLYPSSSSTSHDDPVICDHHQQQGSNVQNCDRSKSECISVEEERFSVVSNSSHTPAGALSVALADEQEALMRKNRKEGLHQLAVEEDGHFDLPTTVPLRLKEEILVEQGPQQEEKQKLLAAAALVELYKKRANELQRQQVEAKSHATAAAAMVLDAAGLVSCCPSSSSQLGGRLALAQEEFFLKKSQELLAPSDNFSHRADAMSLQSAPSPTIPFLLGALALNIQDSRPGPSTS